MFSGKIPAWIVQIPAASVESTSVSATSVAPVRAAAMLSLDVVSRLTDVVEDRTSYDRDAFKHWKPRRAAASAFFSQIPPPPELAYSIYIPAKTPSKPSAARPASTLG